LEADYRFIISESCCLGDGCSPENMCDVANPHLEMPSPSEKYERILRLGMIFLSMSFLSP
jgi:hypothetical protein